MGVYQPQDFLDILGRYPGVDTEHAGVFMAVGKRVDGIGQAALLAYFLEKSATHAAAQDNVEQVGGEAALVGL